jgi:hypothetical protein
MAIIAALKHSRKQAMLAILRASPGSQREPRAVASELLTELEKIVAATSSMAALKNAHDLISVPVGRTRAQRHAPPSYEHGQACQCLYVDIPGVAI